MERWKPLRDFPGYSISDMGRVKNDNTERLLSIIKMPNGHLQVSMQHRDGSRGTRGVAKLVASAFVHNPRPDFFDTPIHLDGKLSNNQASNLMWRPRWFALKFTAQFLADQGEFNQGIRNLRTGEIFEDVWDLVMKEGLLYSDIVMSIENKTYVFPTMNVFEWI